MRFTILLVFIALIMSCSSNKTIKIGYVATLSGKNSELGIGGRTGIRMAVDKWNNAGGINGKEIELVIFNDGGNVETAMKTIDSLKAHDISIVVGHLTSNMKPVVEAGMKEGILYVSPTMSSSSLSIKDDLFVRMINPASYQSELLCENIKSLGYNDLLILIDERNYEYTNDIYENMIACCDKKGDEVQIRKENLHLSQFDRFPQLTKLVDSLKPEAVVVVANGMDFGITAQHLKKSSHSFTLMGPRWASTPDVIEHGGRAVEGAQLVGNIPQRTPTKREQEFIEKFKSVHGTTPSFIPMFVYDAADALFHAIEKADSDVPAVVRDRIIDIGTFESLQGEVVIDSLGDAYRDIIQMITIENGKMVSWPMKN